MNTFKISNINPHKQPLFEVSNGENLEDLSSMVGKRVSIELTVTRDAMLVSKVKEDPEGPWILQFIDLAEGRIIVSMPDYY